MLIVHADRHRLHPTDRPMPGYGRGYPEVPARLDRIREVVEAAFGPAAPPGDFGTGPIEAVHDVGLLAHLRTGFEASRGEVTGDDPYIPHTFAVRGRRPNAGEVPGVFGARAFDTGCPIYRGTWDAVYQATQAALTAADHVRTGGRAAYVMIRPPGHHAGPDFHGGFCYLNHTAIAARFLQRAETCRVAVLDIDYHHGNGTQEVFYRDPEVLFVSLHADPQYDYPFYWGAVDEWGEGPGEGANWNFPLPPGTGDREYLTVLGAALDEVGRFGPRFLVVSAGFDLMAGDPVPRNGGFRITVDGLRQIGERIAGLGLPTVIVQEGGYNLDMLGEYAVTLLRPFAG